MPELAWRVTITPGPAVALHDPLQNIYSEMIRVKNPHETQEIYIGGQNVTVGTGYRLGPGETETFLVHPALGERLYGRIEAPPVVTVQCTRGLN